MEKKKEKKKKKKKKETFKESQAGVNIDRVISIEFQISVYVQTAFFLL